MPQHVLLGVNIDHVATLRQARKTPYPCPIKAALCCEEAGADGITLHLREDRRHIQDDDVVRLRPQLRTKMNLEIAITPFMLDFACHIRPQAVCLVPEKREELTTEGGLDVVQHFERVRDAVKQLQTQDIEVSLFIDPIEAQIDAAIATGAPVIELHTGHYAECTGDAVTHALKQLHDATLYAHPKLIVNAGHGLTCDNVAAIARLPHMNELNIGHALIADSLFVGLDRAVKTMKSKMLHA